MRREDGNIFYTVEDREGVTGRQKMTGGGKD